ncbi:hypothetical protein NDU88_005814 [Pleurodeles waltl]|uniref:Uncharacterized protein n=1 Tax=Pleurodeles waltl TaxID=8319 RepID=A0AAV7RNA9_PLEWA|nr:hypothetical protein NDU88_005814 [Pleurodeles waltl]
MNADSCLDLQGVKTVEKASRGDVNCMACSLALKTRSFPAVLDLLYLTLRVLEIRAVIITEGFLAPTDPQQPRGIHPCDGPLLQQAGPSCRKETDTDSSDPEELAAPSNPLSLPRDGGQEQVMRAFRRCKREDTEWNGGGGESGKEKATRGVTGGEHGVEGFMVTGWHSEDLSSEAEAREAPSARSGHT